MITKQYNMKLVKELHLSGLINSDNSNDAVFFKTNENLPKISEVANIDFLSLEVNRIDNRTFLSNTANFACTDIVANGIQYFRKLIRAPAIPGMTMSYSKDVYDPGLPDQFVYTNSETIEIVATNSTGDTVYTIKLETYPVFIDVRHKHLAYLYSIDNKTFSVKKKKDILFIHTSKDVLAFSKTSNVFATEIVSRNNSIELSLGEFIYGGAVNISGVNSIVKYEYFPYVHNMVSKIKETHLCNSDGLITLRNKNIDIQSFTLKKLNGATINFNLSFFVSSTSGYVDVSYLMQSSMISIGDELEFEYSYLHIDKKYIDIDIKKLNKDSRVHTYVSPTYIATGSVKTHRDKLFGAIITHNKFVTESMLGDISIDIQQSGSIYTFDYTSQNQISTIDPNSFSQFYISNIDEIDSYLNAKLFKNCGIFSIQKQQSNFEECGLISTIKTNFNDFETYNIYAPNICVIGNTEVDVGLGVKRVNVKNVYPIEFNVDSKTASHTYLKIDAYNDEVANILEFVSLDQDLIDSALLDDNINMNYSYDKQKIKCISIISGIEVNIPMQLYFNNTSKELYGKIGNIPGVKVFLKYEDMISSYGIII